MDLHDLEAEMTVGHNYRIDSGPAAPSYEEFFHAFIDCLIVTSCKHTVNFCLPLTVKYKKKKKDLLANVKIVCFGGPSQDFEKAVEGFWAGSWLLRDTDQHTISIVIFGVILLTFIEACHDKVDCRTFANHRCQ